MRGVSANAVLFADKITVLLKDVSASDKVRDMIDAGCLDALLQVIEEAPTNVLFILANASGDPASHPFFFSGRFSFERFLEYPEAREELLRLILNLTYQPFPCSMCLTKLNLAAILASDTIVKDKNRSHQLLLEKIQRNLQVNNRKK